MRAARSNSSEKKNTEVLINKQKLGHLWIEYHLEEGDQV